MNAALGAMAPTLSWSAFPHRRRVLFFGVVFFYACGFAVSPHGTHARALFMCAQCMESLKF
jgi:hypothetical protein